MANALKVEITRLCYIGHKRRREGEVLNIAPRLFSANYMKVLEGEVPKDLQEKYKLKAEPKHKPEAQEVIGEDESEELGDVDDAELNEPSASEVAPKSDAPSSTGDANVI